MSGGGRAGDDGSAGDEGRAGRAGGGIPPDMEDADPGLARERTQLAWTRSAIAFLALAVTIMKFRPVVGIPLLAFGAVTWLTGRVFRRRGAAAPGGAEILLVTVAVTALALVALVITLAGPASRGLQP